MSTNNHIPEQHEGNSLDVEEHHDASTPREAHSIFVEASRRLININTWKDMSGPMSAAFQLTDEHGVPLDRVARQGDYIRINLPGPGTTTGKGYDWVQIESIDDQPNPAGNHESLSITVRPVSSPLNDEQDVAHFFDNSATSTFMIERHDLRITASEHGRNEKPNTDVERTSDKLRNTMVATAATSGLAALQWNWLVQGVLKDV